jgi:L-2-hydroxyglutarate oxidase LhgO
MKTTDFLVIGGGILGISVARELKKRFKDCRVIILEKENELAWQW